MLEIPGLTLFVIDGGVGRPLIKLALRDTLNQIKPEATIIFSENPFDWEEPEWLECGFYRIRPCTSVREAMAVFWTTVPWNVNTEFMMHVEWDGWIVDASAWDPEFLSYDYIGAPWPWYSDGLDVGNGLGIRSTRLMRFLSNHRTEFPIPVQEDDGICRVYRPKLEKKGFRWAPRELASRFSWERGPRPGPTFAFHGVFNWTSILTYDQLTERLALATDYERSKPEWPELMAGIEESY